MSTPIKSATKSSNRKKFTPRPAGPAEERLPRLYRALADQVDDGHLGNAIRTCRKILQLDPTSTSAFQTLLFLHLHTDDYPAALQLLSKPVTATVSLDFERAYCLYRLHREKEALDVLERLNGRGRKERHLEAQIRYRLGEYEKAQELYDDLLAGCDSNSPEHPDILTNLSATTAHIDFISHSYNSYLHQPPPTDLSSSTGLHIPTEGELESYVPSLPTGWAVGGVEAVKKAAPAKKEVVVKKEDKKGKTKHRLPKGAAPGKAFTEDPERWLPLRQRTSFLQAQTKKKGGNQSMGTGFTQGSTSTAQASAGSGGGGGKSKKGKKK